MSSILTTRRVVLTLCIAAAFALIVGGFALTEESDPQVSITDSAVRRVFPAGGNLDVRQARIGFQLTPEYVGRLEVDGTPIPDDQVRFQIGLNIYEYQPGPGTETGALEPGRHRARAIFWKKGKDERAARSYAWTFNVH